MIDKRETLILYTTATCNLNCKYCFIDKNPSLLKIDEILDNSFKDDYYFNLTKKMFLQDKLSEIQFWGGEPFLNLKRAYNTVDKCIQYFPKLSKFMASTNFVSEPFFEQFFGFMELLGKYPERKFNFNLQMSLDGPEYITDINRGLGVTKAFSNKFPVFIDKLQNGVPANVHCKLHFKPTLDTSSIAMLQTKEKVLEYFQFFENFQTIFKEHNHLNNITFGLPVPNTACPSPHTKEEGIMFANYCKLTREIESDKTLKYYKVITSFANNKNNKCDNVCLNGQCIGHCGNGRRSVGLLPNNMVSCCHNGFVDLIGDYKENVAKKNSEHMDEVTVEKGIFDTPNNSMIFTIDSPEFKAYENKLDIFYRQDNTCKITNLASLVLLLADAGQIDEQYKIREKAIEASIFILKHTAFCVRDNLGVTGSIYLYPFGLIKLLLNGAKEYIEKTEIN